MTRVELTEKVVRIKIEQGLGWAELAALTAGLLRQMTPPAQAAEAIGDRLGLEPYEVRLPPPPAVPTDPLVYRFHELVSV